jgi:hypothetical protein
VPDVIKSIATLAATTSLLALAATAVADDNSGSGSGATLQSVTQNASDLTDHSAILHGKLGFAASALSATVHFEYGKGKDYGTSTADTPALFTGNLFVTSGVSGLDAGTEYHYRLVGTGLFGTLTGDDQSFTTNAVPAAPGDSSATTLDSTLLSTNAGLGESLGNNGQDGSSVDAKPRLGRDVVAGASSGSVAVKIPGATGFATLAGNAPVPVGSLVDARRGSLRLVTALPDGTTQTGTFHGAVFQVRQSATGQGMVDLVLKGGSFAACKSTAARASVSAAGRRSRVVRRLWGNDHHGRFRTRGSNSIATVRGTSWVTTDRCDGTLTSVSKGSVSVRDLRRNKSVLVRAGHSYLAHR